MAVGGTFLLVTRNFPPLVGGMERVNLHLCQALAGLGPTTLVGPRGAGESAPAGVRVRESPLRPLPAFLFGTALRALCEALSRRPSLVLAGSGLSAPIAWLAARLRGARCAVYLHGLDIVAPSRVYAMAWLPFIRRCDIVICNSSHTRDLAIAHGVPARGISILNPGTEVPARKVAAPADAFRAAYALGRRPILLSVGRFTRRKGLAEFVARSLPDITRAIPEVALVIVGDEASDALHGGPGNERERISNAALDAGVSGNLVFAGRLDEAMLDGAYSAAACHVFPVLQVPGDVEGFGMVALEAAARGLRTVAFGVGGIPDAVSVPDSGELVTPNDYAGLTRAVLSCVYAGRGDEEYEAARRFARSKDWAAFHEQFRRIISAP